jgi:putative tryptophan/tyrosine transport system substrate-binding protein
MIKRREFVVGLGSVAAWPLAVRAQSPQRRPGIGVLMNLSVDDPEGLSRLATFHQGLQEGGWTIERNLRIDYRWAAGNAELYRKYAIELVALMPDVILAGSGAAIPWLLQATHSVPIVFVQTPDPVGIGIVASLAHPGGNITGFTNFEFPMGGKILGVLKEIAPRIIRIGVLRNSADPQGGVGQWAAIQTAATSLGIEATSVGVHNADEIERGITAFANGANGGLIVTGNAPAVIHRDLIIRLAARHRLPAIYPFRYFVNSGGLISYGPDVFAQFRGAAGYVSRILAGEKPADLPVQTPTKYELVLNLKTARALGVIIPEALLVTADEVIQ